MKINEIFKSIQGESIYMGIPTLFIRTAGCNLRCTETSGNQDIGLIKEGAIIVMDLKCPSSGESKKNDWRNIDKLEKDDQVKFVIGTREDYEWAKGIIEKCGLTDRAVVLMSVVYEKLKPEVLIKWILEDNLRVRFQPQLHKLIWGPNIRAK